MLRKRGLSGVVTVLILVLLVVTLVSFVWVMVKNLVEDRLEEAESCFGIFDAVTINSKYTCYNSSSYDVQFSINVGDVDLEKLIVSVFDSSTKASKSYEITNVLSTVADLSAYPSGAQVVIPNKSSGRTYIGTGFSGKPGFIEVAPIIDGKACKVSDTVYDIPDCSILAS
ncbi:MAG: hypothetical protein PVJ67_02390 [Candidatus Pacearchaeota archaeon]|jgi:flagellin-like protein